MGRSKVGYHSLRFILVIFVILACFLIWEAVKFQSIQYCFFPALAIVGAGLTLFLIRS